RAGRLAAASTATAVAHRSGAAGCTRRADVEVPDSRREPGQGRIAPGPRNAATAAVATRTAAGIGAAAEHAATAAVAATGPAGARSTRRAASAVVAARSAASAPLAPGCARGSTPAGRAGTGGVATTDGPASGPGLARNGARVGACGARRRGHRRGDQVHRRGLDGPDSVGAGTGAGRRTAVDRRALDRHGGSARDEDAGWVRPGHS